ncbi:hypothetical protein [Bacillus pseudomycoides]|nr:hypothetical protein [Bacillus pseudomycoides]MED4710050.1 hypothetical protein [Bacillus pseudomycoides]
MVYKDILKKIHDAPTDYDFSKLTESIIDENLCLMVYPKITLSS